MTHTDERRGATRAPLEIPTITPAELAAERGDARPTVVDVRPIAAFNGWRLGSEPRGGHVPGAVAFPIAWLETVDPDEIDRLLAEKRITADRAVVVSGHDEEDAARFARHLVGRGIGDVRVLAGGFAGWACRSGATGRAPAPIRATRPYRLAAAPARGRAAGDAGRRRGPAAPRQLRRAGGIRGGPPARRGLPRHQPPRGPGRLEPALVRPRSPRRCARSGSPGTRPSSSTVVTRRVTPTRSGPAGGPARSPRRGRR